MWGSSWPASRTGWWGRGRTGRSSSTATTRPRSQAGRAIVERPAYSPSTSEYLSTVCPVKTQDCSFVYSFVSLKPPQVNTHNIGDTRAIFYLVVNALLSGLKTVWTIFFPDDSFVRVVNALGFLSIIFCPSSPLFVFLWNFCPYFCPKFQQKYPTLDTRTYVRLYVRQAQGTPPPGFWNGL